MNGQRLLSSWLGLALFCGAMTGCVSRHGGDLPNAPTRTLAGFFGLTQVNGSLIPAVSAPSPPNACPGFLDSGRLLLAIDPQTYELATSTRFDCGTGNGARFSNDTETGTWTLDGGPETFTITFTPTTSIYGLTTGTIDTVSLKMRFNALHQDAGRPAFSINTTWLRR